MDEIIDRRFERVEKALATLITSISTYNPAPALANDLHSALSTQHTNYLAVSTHQSNHAKILSLQSTSQDLDTQIKETLILLTTTRSALLSTPSTSFPPSTSTNPVSYSELLSYARRISKFTLPTSYRESKSASAQQPGSAEETGANTPRESKSGTQTNGTATPVNGVERERDMQMDIDSGTPIGSGIGGGAPQTTNASNNTALPTEYSRWLNPPPDLFLPWPTEETIRRGALASIQILVDTGVDPATFDPARSAELEAERKRIQEEEDRAREEGEERMREVKRRMSSAGAGAGSGEVRMQTQEKAKAFQLETFDDDDEDD
ncbi:Mediator of RNA polymerase II transcription subunit [Lachnellula occidentalis]|uniref:Mediator of RNA polymerase II transcription subunit 4 n=1 Tax=Lachnellula occidentalis TaxID=215460 RepID=A0A8H8RS65_9HELO|nr:Mediator of RNA polymerase II transcription subunit [Lachnellula occidentalis]